MVLLITQESQYPLNIILTALMKMHTVTLYFDLLFVVALNREEADIVILSAGRFLRLW